MMPRRSNLATFIVSEKPKQLQPFSLLSYGIRLKPKQRLLPKTSNKVTAAQCQIIQTSGLNLQEKLNNLQHMHFSNRFHDYQDQQRQKKYNQNQECKQQNENSMLQSNRNAPKPQIFSDQISRNANPLKLNNITNMCRDQMPSLKLNSLKSQPASSFDCQFLQDNGCDYDLQFKTQKVYVDMKKKIKKVSKSKRLHHNSQRIQPHMLLPGQAQQQDRRKEMAQHHRNLINHAFLDQEVIIDSSMFCKKLIHHRIDNDVETDEEQIKSGVSRLNKWLQQAVQQNRTWIAEVNNLMEEIQDSEDSQMHQQLCGTHQAYLY